MLDGKSEEGRKQVKSALDRAVAEWNAARARLFTRAAQSTVDAPLANKSPVDKRKRKLPPPPGWWNGDTAASESMIAARQLGELKGAKT